MIRYVLNGKYRATQIILRQMRAGQEVTGNGFPITEDLLQAFGSYSAIDEDALVKLTDQQYEQRYQAFRNHLIAKHSFLRAPDFAGNGTGTDANACVPGTIVEQEIGITPDTTILIFFDSSGSMNSTLSPLNTMRNTLLKNALLPFYNNDSALYDSMVNVVSESSERTLRMLNNQETPMATPHLIMVFQDEASPAYTSSTSHVPRTYQYDTDIAALRQTLNSLPSNFYRGIIFQVSRSADDGAVFRALLTDVQNSNGEYSGAYGLGDRDEIAFVYDVQNGGQPSYYMDLLVNTMRQLGYRL